MTVEILTGFGDNYIYVIGDDRRGKAVAIDPGAAEPVLRCLERVGAGLETILITHRHGDHTGGCAELKSATHCSVIGPSGALAHGDRQVADGEAIVFGETEFRVIEVPGHTREDVAYYSQQLRSVWTGDTLFAAGCGRVLGGSAGDMWRSLLRLRDLPEDTLVYCGHDYTVENLEFAAHLEPGNEAVSRRLAGVRAMVAGGEPTVPSTIASERATNPFLRSDTQAMRLAVGLPAAPDVEVFAELRRRKDRW